MIRAVFAADLFRRPVLAASMFRDRTTQFRDRHGWAVTVDDMGLEFDQYDGHNPLYLIVEGEDGDHLGSTRLMPTTGPTMIADHFLDLTGGVAFESALIWESTRFCISPRLPADRRAAGRVATTLLWAGTDVAVRAGVEFFVAVFSRPMFRFYEANGWNPEVLGSRETDEGTIYAGLWEVTPAIRDDLARRAGLGDGGRIDFFPAANRFPFLEDERGPAPRAFGRLEGEADTARFALAS